MENTPENTPTSTEMPSGSNAGNPVSSKGRPTKTRRTGKKGHTPLTARRRKSTSSKKRTSGKNSDPVSLEKRPAREPVIIIPDDFVPVYGASIPKTDLASLPPAPYRGSITMIDTLEKVHEAIEELRKADLIGFDTETKPSFKRGQHYNVALLQLSAGEKCFLFRLNLIGMPEEVKALLEDEQCTKVGLSIHDDFRHLQGEHGVEPAGFIELQNFVKGYEIADNSLSRIYGILFGHRVSKSQRLTNWEADELSEPQQRYAAFDALACIDIYKYLKAGRFSAKDSPYWRVINLPQPQIPKDDE